MEMKADIYAATLAYAEGVGAKRLRALMDVFGGSKALWETDSDEIRRSGILGNGKTLEKFLEVRRTMHPEEVEEKMRRLGIGCMTSKDAGYPPLLKETANPPAVLFYKGALPDYEKTVAIVGARKATPYGIGAAKNMAEALARKGVVIVSGGARGIDTASHEGCMAGGAPTVAVFACGLDVTYPPENRNLFLQIVETGGTLLSEYPPGTRPLGRQFPARNRIIAGMSRGVLVTEAAIRSGSLITADFALEEGRDVFAIPGSILWPMSQGTNHLIRNGAICTTAADDILSEYDWEETEEGLTETTLPLLSSEEEMVYRFCTMAATVSTEDILVQSGMTMPKLTMLLLSLAMKGFIVEAGPGLYAAAKVGK